MRGIFFVNTRQTKEHCSRSALLFGNEAHLRCMKRVAKQLVKQGFALLSEPSAHGEVSVRFASRERSECFVEAARLLLHIRGANASFLLALRGGVCYNIRRKPCDARFCTSCYAHYRAPALLMASQKCPCKHTFLLHDIINSKRRWGYEKDI